MRRWLVVWGLGIVHWKELNWRGCIILLAADGICMCRYESLGWITVCIMV